MKMFRFIVYLMAIFPIMLLDHYLLPNLCLSPGMEPNQPDGCTFSKYHSIRRGFKNCSGVDVAGVAGRYFRSGDSRGIDSIWAGNRLT